MSDVSYMARDLESDMDNDDMDIELEKLENDLSHELDPNFQSDSEISNNGELKEIKEIIKKRPVGRPKLLPGQKKVQPKKEVPPKFELIYKNKMSDGTVKEVSGGKFKFLYEIAKCLGFEGSKSSLYNIGNKMYKKTLHSASAEILRHLIEIRDI